MGIYREKERLEKEVKYLINSSINQENKDLILEFKSYLIASGIGLLRTIRYMTTLRSVAERYNGRVFSDWTKKDVIEALEKIEIQDFSGHTKKEFRKGLKKFFKWNKGENWEGLDPLKGSKRIDRKPDILTKDEIIKLIQVTRHPRDKAIISLLYEGGFRIGELASITFKDIEFNKFGGKVKVRGKTGERLVPFVISESYLKVWMEMHPNPRDNESLFVSIGYKSYGGPLSYEMYNLVLKKALKRAGITKKISPHSLRHSRATHLASTLTESEMCHYLGWQMGSDMPRIYVHLSGRDIDKAIYSKVYGLDTGEKKEEGIKPVSCPRCKENCGPASEYCYRCGMPLNEEKVLNIEKIGQEIRNNFFQFAQENPSMLGDMKMFMEMSELLKHNPNLKADFFKMASKKK
ncbi:MAG: putative tyrosine recombinase XerC-like protein [Candidatus Methanofastidiosum methylothiophilum]|jgi:site-specific recombinase XerD|uniref:Putative tyrosine recombinase XerC-like protein n=1 Tax=Candidatus Methanofastidiosum methylothiophilum TaxID=1705564 RepID=A0A150J8W6_9EURY|nr:MAG: putative tyrosine recombinase XerC-like protein [Candidatus Methanofastidiosum methylthiophilus]